MLEISKDANVNYLCKVVVLKDLQKHSNADRLQVAIIGMPVSRAGKVSSINTLTYKLTYIQGHHKKRFKVLKFKVDTRPCTLPVILHCLCLGLGRHQ